MKPLFLGLLFVIPFFAVAQSIASEGMTVVGVIEHVRVDPGGLIFSAKLDTGADHSSLHARSIHRFKRGGESWVRFKMVNDQGQSVQLERKLVRLTRIKSPEGKQRRRPVVMLTLCLGNISRSVQVNLVNRSRLRNKMIVGRSFMRNALVVDPARKFTVEPKCPQQPEE